MKEIKRTFNWKKQKHIKTELGAYTNDVYFAIRGTGNLDHKGMAELSNKIHGLYDHKAMNYGSSAGSTSYGVKRYRNAGDRFVALIHQSNYIGE